MYFPYGNLLICLFRYFPSSPSHCFIFSKGTSSTSVTQKKTCAGKNTGAANADLLVNILIALVSCPSSNFNTSQVLSH